MMKLEARNLASRRNAESSTSPRTADYAKQSQFRDPRLPRRYATRNDMHRREVDHAKQSQFRWGQVKANCRSGKGYERKDGSCLCENKANLRADGGRDPPYKVAEGLPCKTKPISPSAG